jgi:hypothetical protein
MDTSTLKNIEIDGVEWTDYPDFVDAYIVYAEDANGKALTYDQLTKVAEDHPDFVQEMAHEQIPF